MIAFKVLTCKHTGRRPLGRPGLRWEDNIRMDLKEICINTRNCVDSDQDRDYWRGLVNAALNLRVSEAMELLSLRLMLVSRFLDLWKRICISYL